MLDIDAGDTRAAAFKAINPNGRVPALAHDGEVLWESAAILMHLGETFGVDRGLYPPPGMARAHAMKWIVWSAATLGEAAGRLSAALPAGQAGAVQAGSVDFIGVAEHDAERRGRALADLDGLLAIMNGALAEADYLLGAYSLVDVHLSGLVGWIDAMGGPVNRHPAVGAWRVRCATHG
ncbi:MAG: glutathione S-transferase family protein [Alphaproteobacteria bacterium]|nr:glutathione S-transferase family protein [Alphaproteobacteria bacterium]